MIPVQLQPEPSDFDVEVRKKGQSWLAKNGIAVNAPPPKASDLPDYWRACLEQLYDAYSGVCAYLAIYFEWPTGAASTDHYVPKSANAWLAYEWSNFRLSCIGPNRTKNKYTDVLDPIELKPDTFHLNLMTGRIRPNPAFSVAARWMASRTIARLKLNAAKTTAMRAKHYSEYVRIGNGLPTLKQVSPFVWYEANRQGAL